MMVTIMLTKYMFFLDYWYRAFVSKFLNFLVPYEIRKGYWSMTPGAYGTHRVYEAHGTSGIN
jgi:hypothetical protein